MEHMKQTREETERRIYTGRTSKMIISPQERKKVREEKLKERFDFEKKRCVGGYELIYPAPGESPEVITKN